jgi:hypothetical protein
MGIGMHFKRLLKIEFQHFVKRTETGFLITATLGFGLLGFIVVCPQEVGPVSMLG